MQWSLANVDSVIQNATHVLKNDRTSTVVVINLDGIDMVIKRSNTKDIWHFIRRLFWRSRAQKNWNYANQLLSLGIKTLEPIALVEERYGILRRRSYFIWRYIEGTLALNYFKNYNLYPNWKQMVIQIANLLAQLANHRLSHRDLNLSNILLVKDKPCLIDLDSMRHHWCHFTAKRGAKREWERFMANWREIFSDDSFSFAQLLKEMQCLKKI
jgi:tRNA A-37 threonylcarbamoyl transferase component Bud32